MRKWLWLVILLFIITSPILIWHAKPTKKINLLIFDKTVPDDTFREHQGLTWLVNYKKYNQPSGAPYRKETDYAGTVPIAEKKYTDRTISQLSNSPQLIYTADTYGIDTSHSKGSRGGISKKEWTELQELYYDQQPVWVSEYNSFASPTSKDIRNDFLNFLNIDWTGWIGRRFEELDPAKNKEIPRWAIEAYETQEKHKWKSSGPGFLFIHENGKIVVLEKRHLKSDKLTVKFTARGTKEFNLKESPRYNYWFDVITPRNQQEVMANYEWKLNNKGKKLLSEHGIPDTFAAVTKTEKNGSPAFYFAGDYNDINNLPSFYKVTGLIKVKSLFTSENSADSDAFYWNTYAPMMETLIDRASRISPKKTQAVKTDKEEVDGISINAKVADDRFQVLKNGKWEPLTIKGVNMGMGKPGAWPGEAAISEEEYYRWIKQIGEMNANAIRVYTLHPPGFYRALKRYNEQAEKPIYLFHGIWIDEEPLEEKLDAFDGGIMKQFKSDIRTIVNVVHGNAEVPEKPGHASGSYKADVSPYLIGWIVGIEWYPDMVDHTNKKHQEKGDFIGTYMQTKKAQPFEYWLASMMDYTLQQETKNYGTQHPISFTNWVTTDLLDHPYEPLEQEDLVGINPNVIHPTKQLKTGYFAAYHVYPYYPDFLNIDENYLKYKDHRGKTNSYAGYLHDLKKAHTMPVLIAEFGLPASRGITHSNPYGWNQGHNSEEKQGEVVTERFEDIIKEGYTGGLVFNWQDEWFKRTWNTMEFDDPNRRPYWSNAQTNEQQFGIVSFDRLKIRVDGKTDDWDKANVIPVQLKKNSAIKQAFITHDERYLYVRLDYNQTQAAGMDTTLLIDTIAQQGNKNISYNGGITSERGIDFLLRLNGKDDSRMLVDSYYDSHYFMYGEKLNLISKKPYASKKNNGTFHKIEMALNKTLINPVTKQRYPFESFETGKLEKGNGNPDSKNYNSLADYEVNEKTGIVEIRIPWMLLNVKDPSTKEIAGDYWKDGMEASKKIKAISFAATAGSEPIHLRADDFFSYSWKPWEQPQYEERLKQSYSIIKREFAKYE
ncbi:hypothetical protein [Bacillus sp. PK3_68]|uniref:hypothetical protein n=1 Tax=Bacillus sp. PK3_68 TaxID=2027408 RepID=UPI000E717F2E|nr:hypothetical protein [Bacillus sp. PK3_68]RJS58673.1 hypothetical protein CJ483_00150 [Bacillus sp. PK3_68]